MVLFSFSGTGPKMKATLKQGHFHTKSDKISPINHFLTQLVHLPPSYATKRSFETEGLITIHVGFECVSRTKKTNLQTLRRAVNIHSRVVVHCRHCTSMGSFSHQKQIQMKTLYVDSWISLKGVIKRRKTFYANKHSLLASWLPRFPSEFPAKTWNSDTCRSVLICRCQYTAHMSSCKMNIIKAREKYSFITILYLTYCSFWYYILILSKDLALYNISLL